MIVISDTGDFNYRQCWDSNPDKSQDWDHTQVYNNTIYVKHSNQDAVLSPCGGTKKKPVSLTLAQAQKQGKDPGSLLVKAWPTTAEILDRLDGVLGKYFPSEETQRV